MRAVCIGVALFILGSAVPACADTRRYTDREIACVADALYMEGGSIKATTDELRTMAHTIKVRAETDTLWARKDWGGPDLCSVVRWKIGKKRKVCQYSFWCRSKREIRRFRNPIAVLARAVLGYRDEEYYPGNRIRVTYDELWLRGWYAAYAVFGDPVAKRWKPGGDLHLADTYQHWCSSLKYHLPSCKEALVSSPRSKCWFALGNVETDTQLSELHRLHIYYRSIEAGEVLETQYDPEKYFPEECSLLGKRAERYVQRVRQGQYARLSLTLPKVATLMPQKAVENEIAETPIPRPRVEPEVQDKRKKRTPRKAKRERHVNRIPSAQFFIRTYY